MPGIKLLSVEVENGWDVRFSVSEATIVSAYSPWEQSMVPRLSIREDGSETIWEPKRRWVFAGIIEATDEELTELQREGGYRIRDLRNTSVLSLLEEFRPHQIGSNSSPSTVLIDEKLAEERAKTLSSECEKRARAEERARADGAVRALALEREERAKVADASARVFVEARQGRVKAEEWAKVAEEWARAAEEWARAAEERARVAEERAISAEESLGKRIIAGIIVVGAILLLAVVLRGRSV